LNRTRCWSGGGCSGDPGSLGQLPRSASHGRCCRSSTLLLLRFSADRAPLNVMPAILVCHRLSARYGHPAESVLTPAYSASTIRASGTWSDVGVLWREFMPLRTVRPWKVRTIVVVPDGRTSTHVLDVRDRFQVIDLKAVPVSASAFV